VDVERSDAASIGPRNRVTAATPRERLARASFWTMAGAAVQLCSGMLTSIAAARILGPLHFGELAITRTTLFTAAMIAGANLGLSASRAVAALARTDPQRAGRVIGLLFNLAVLTSGGATLLCVLLAGPIARQLAAPHLRTAIAVSAPYIVFASLSAVQTGILIGLDAFRSAGSLLALEGFLTMLLLVGAAYRGGVVGAVAGIVVATAIAFLVRRDVLAARCRGHGIVVQHRGVTGEFPLIRDLVVPAVIVGLGAPPFAWMARAMLTRQDHGLVSVGLFSAAYAWGSSVLTIGTQVTRPAMPILTSVFAAGGTEDFRRLLRDTVLLTFSIAMLAALPMMLLSPWIMRAFGPMFESGALVLTIIVASSVLGAVSSALRSALVASSSMWGQAMQSLLWGLTLVGTFYVLRRQGAVGLATAYLVAFAIALMVQAAMTLQASRRPRQPIVPIALPEPIVPPVM
jgi:O-antigen/teichoic acid export membrane protein